MLFHFFDGTALSCVDRDDLQKNGSPEDGIPIPQRALPQTQNNGRDGCFFVPDGCRLIPEEQWATPIYRGSDFQLGLFLDLLKRVAVCVSKA